MSSPAHPHDHGHDHAHAHAHHGHTHAPSSPHPPMVLPSSFLRLSVAARLGIVLVASAVLWSAVWLAMR